MSGVQEIQQQRFHGVVVVVCVSDFIALMFHSDAIDRAAAKEGAGKARRVFRTALNHSRDIDFFDFMGDIQRVAETGKSFGVEVFAEQRVDGQRAQGKFPFCPFAHHCKRIGQKQAVLAAGKPDQDIIAALDHLELDDGAHDLTEISLWETEFHKRHFLCCLSIISHTEKSC